MVQVHTIDRDTNDITDSSYSQSRGRRSDLVFGFAALGAFSFWFPDVLLHLHAGLCTQARISIHATGGRSPSWPLQYF